MFPFAAIAAILIGACETTRSSVPPPSPQKMTTPIPEYEQLYFQRAVEAMIATTPAASLSAFRASIRQWGPDNETMIYWHGRMDSKVLLLTPNTTVVYGFMWIDLKDGPMVMETPPNVLGIIDDFWFEYVTDFGQAGEDRGKGGKYLLLPPDYDGPEPEGYIVRRSKTFGNWFIMRGFMKDFDADPVVANMKEHYRLYPLGEQPREVDWIDVAGKPFNTIHATDAGFFEEVNIVVQEEPNSAASPELLGLLAGIGIEKGKPFNPDGRQIRTLNEAAAVGTAALRSILFQNRVPDYAAFPGSKSWETGFPGGSCEFLKDGVRKFDQRVRFHFFATGITPAMVKPPVGKGSQYCMGIRDSKGRPLDGSKAYKLHVPPNVPMNNFWDVTIYDVQTRSLLQTDNPFPGVTSIDAGTVLKADGSCDIWIGPEKPKGNVNWIQTVPGKGCTPCGASTDRRSPGSTKSGRSETSNCSSSATQGLPKGAGRSRPFPGRRQRCDRKSRKAAGHRGSGTCSLPRAHWTI